MAERILRQTTRQLLFRGSNSIPATRHVLSRRQFHATAPRNDALLDSLLYLPHEMMALIHSQVPWYAAIPLTAFITRGLLVTTAGAWARSLTARYVGLQPLRQALAFQKRDEIQRKGGFRHPKEAILAVTKEIKKLTTDLDKRWNVTIRGQIGWTFGQIPIFFAMAETIRQKCGARDGLMAMGLSAFKSDDAASTVDNAVTASRWFEPSLANEGILWFQDLLIPDPTGTLPFIVSGLMFANIYFTKNTVHNEATWPKMVRRSLLVVSLAIGPMCQDLPAALLFYWGSSTTSVMIWNAWLDWKYPVPRNFTACRRPLQLPPKVLPQRRKN